ncbi:ROK family transcriptional regulator [Arthrobacter sp. HLT1-20]
MERLGINSPKTLRWMNSRALLAALMEAGRQVSVTELAGQLGLTRPTVEAALVDLLAEGWVAESSPAPTPHKAGRRARLYQFRANAGYLLGIDMGPRQVHAMLANLQGKIVASVRHSGLDIAAGAGAESALQTAVREVLAQAGVPPTAVVAAAIGVPGVVSRGGELVRSVVVPDWIAGGTLGRIAAFLHPAVTLLDNDARLATTAEAAGGVLAGVDNGVHVVLGRQMGAGLLIDGKVVRGHHGAAGEIGGLGSLGWAAAADAVAGPDGSVAAVVEGAARGEAWAVAAVEDFAKRVANGIAALSLAVDPEVISVGGDMAAAGELLLHPLREAVARLGMFEPELHLSAVGADAVMLGALAHARDHFRHNVLELAALVPRPL